ncbi:MAG: hypothetical protein U0Y68_25895 [Blastocatellia bacterium]
MGENKTTIRYSLRSLGRRVSLLIVGLLFLIAVAAAQTATISGTLSGFDVNNLTGQVAHGFEIQIEGATANDLYYTGFGQRYGNGSVVSYPGGVYVRWKCSLYDQHEGLFQIHADTHERAYIIVAGLLSWWRGLRNFGL